MSFFKKIRFIARLAQAFFSRHKKIIFISALLAVLTIFFIYKVLPALPQPKKIIKIAQIGRCQTDELTSEIKKKLSMGLTVLAIDGSPQPGLAEKWDISEDNLTYTFYLRDKLFWTDNSKVKAYDINYQFEGVQRNVIDEKTLQFRLSQPYAPFLTLVSQPVFKKNFIGVGPYKIKKIDKSGNSVKKIYLESANDILIYIFYPTSQKAITGFKLGEVDIIENLYNLDLEKEWLEKIEIEEKVDKKIFLGLFFNLNTPMFSEKKIRQALNYATLKDSENRALSPISVDSWAYNSDVKPYYYSSEKAQELFKDDKGKPLKIDKIKLSTSEPFFSLAKNISQNWQEVLKLDVEIQLINHLSDDYHVFLGLQEIPPDPDQYFFWHSTREENITHLKNLKIDKLLEDGRRISDKNKRLDIYREFQKVICEESPVIFLSYPKTYTLKRKSLNFNL